MTPTFRHLLLGKLCLLAVIGITATTQVAPAARRDAAESMTSWEAVIVGVAVAPVGQQQGKKKKDAAYGAFWSQTSWSRRFGGGSSNSALGSVAGSGGANSNTSNSGGGAGGNNGPRTGPGVGPGPGYVPALPKIFGPGWIPVGTVPPPISRYIP